MKRTPATYAAGEVFEAVYPFFWDTYMAVDSGTGEDDVHVAEVGTWKPGVRHEDVGEGDVTSFADALGKVIVTVVSTHRPGRFPQRVFFTRTWETPEGKRFGKNKLHVVSARAFWAAISGYRHAFVLLGCECDGCKWPYEDHRKRGYSQAYDEAQSVEVSTA